MKINYRWPARPENNYAPLYVVLLRLPFLPLMLLGFFLMFISIMGTCGPRRAVDFFEEHFQ